MTTDGGAGGRAQRIENVPRWVRLDTEASQSGCERLALSVTFAAAMPMIEAGEKGIVDIPTSNDGDFLVWSIACYATCSGIEDVAVCYEMSLGGSTKNKFLKKK